MIKNGLLVKGVGGLYSVQTDDALYTCTARGVFRNKKISPLAGDKVSILIEDEEKKTASIQTIEPRKNTLLRPAAANIDRVIVTMAAAQPDFNAGLLDRFLIIVARAGIEAVVCINKSDLLGPSVVDAPLFMPYKMAGYPVIFVSAKTEGGLAPLHAALAGKLTVFAGPSGVGKSSLINTLLPHAQQEVGEISTKLRRGKHTTRAATVNTVNANEDVSMTLAERLKNGYVVDTPGFSSLDIEQIPPRELGLYFKEFLPFIGLCKFTDCTHNIHDKTEHCAVKAQINKKIHKKRYDSYLKIMNHVV